MGTDVYLEWKGMTKKQKEARYAGFGIDAGKKGYLRASIGMVEENGVLRRVFPEKFWKGEKHAYDFLANEKLVVGAIAEYLMCCVTDTNDEVIKKQQFMGQLVSIALGAELKSGTLDNESRHIWAKSLAEFVMLGMKLQKEGKEPKVLISW